MRKSKFYLGMFFGFLSLVASLSSAQNVSTGINFQGVIKTPSGDFPTISGTTIIAKVLSPNDCILREERFSGVNISNGYVNLVIGRGVPTSNNPDPSRDLRAVMNNSVHFTGLLCLSPDGSVNALKTTYEPQGGDIRKLRISMQINQDNVVADFNMRSVAYAVNAESINGKNENNFINVNAVDGLTQANAESVFQRYTQLNNILNGSFAGAVIGNVTGDLTGNVTGNVTGTAANVTGVVAVANGGTGANSPESARSNLGLKGLSVIDLPSPLDPSKFLRGDGTWASVVGGVSSVAGRSGDVVITADDLADFNSKADTRAMGVVSGLKAQINGLASLDSAGKIPSAQLGLTSSDIPQIDANKITSGTLEVNVNSSSVNAGVGQFTQLKMNDGAGKVLTMTRQAGGLDYNIQWPANVGVAGSVLQTDQNGVLSWAAIPSAPVSTVAGKVGEVTLVKEDIGGLGTAAGLNVGTNTGELVQLDSGSKIPSSVLPSSVLTTSTTVGGDLSGSFPNPTVAKIRNVAVAETSLMDGQVYRYNGATQKLEPVYFGVDDLRTSSGISQFATNCSASQTLTWSAVSDAFSCTNISGLAASVISSGTISGDRLPAGATAWGAVTGGISYGAGNIGVGTDTPKAKVEVAGGIKLGADGDACNSTKEGTLKYTSPHLYVCNGTSWKIVQLLDPAPNVVLISGSGANMDVPNISVSQYGSNVTFTYQNQGAVNTNTISASLLSSANFEIVSNSCHGVILAPNNTCTVVVRPMASVNGSYSTTLRIIW